MEKLYKLGNIKIHADLIAGLPCESYSRFAQSFNSVYGKCDEIQIDLMFTPDINEFRGIRSVQLIVRDVKVCRRTVTERKAMIEGYSKVADDRSV